MDIAGILIGLGNPGAEYAITRHNFGFMAIDVLQRSFAHASTTRLLSGTKDPYELWRICHEQQYWLLAKPLAYMNRSGEAAARIMHFYKISPANLLVLHDELDLPFGRMKMKRGGGNAGHNGLKSLQQHLGTADFARLRLGIGRPPGYDASSYVLGRFSQEEQQSLPDILGTVCSVFALYAQGKEEEAVRQCNSFTL